VSTTRVSFFPKYSVVNKQEKRSRNQENGRKEKEEEEEETEEHGRKSRLAGTASTRREKSAETPLAAVNLSLANRVPSRRSGGTAKSTSSSFYYQVRKSRPGIFIGELLHGIISQKGIFCKGLNDKVWTFCTMQRIFFMQYKNFLGPIAIQYTGRLSSHPQRATILSIIASLVDFLLHPVGYGHRRKKSTKAKFLNLNISTVKCSKTRSAQKV
jgi:hypothetical protein